MTYLIIGGNATGMSAASRLRKNDPDAVITVIEKGDLVSFGACGLPYFIGEEFTHASDMIARSFDAFKRMKIDILLHHEAVKLDHEAKSVTVKDLAKDEEKIFKYDKLLVSTGAVPIIPPFPNVDLKGIRTLTKMHDGIAMKEALRHASKIVIIGAGFIGIETAEAMIHHNKQVTIIEKESRAVGKVFDAEITEHLEKAIKKSGVKLKLNESVTEFRGKDVIQKVVTDKGTYNADLVLLSVGFSPATKWCRDTGIEMLPNGAIVIDEYGRTSLPDVYSGGDCAGVLNAVSGKLDYIPLATTANKLGRLIGDNMIKDSTPFQGTLGSSGLRFCTLQAGRTGLSEGDAERLGIDYSTNFIQDFNHTSYVANQTPLYIKLIYEKHTRVLLGGQICGEQDAVLRVDVLAAAIFKKMTVDELGMMDFIYAPPFARTWDALNIAGNTSK